MPPKTTTREREKRPKALAIYTECKEDFSLNINDCPYINIEVPAGYWEEADIHCFKQCLFLKPTKPAFVKTTTTLKVSHQLLHQSHFTSNQTVKRAHLKYLVNCIALQDVACLWRFLNKTKQLEPPIREKEIGIDVITKSYFKLRFKVLIWKLIQYDLDLCLVMEKL